MTGSAHRDRAVEGRSASPAAPAACTLGAGLTCTIGVDFTPPADGPKMGTLTVSATTSDPQNATVVFDLECQGVDQVLAIPRTNGWGGLALGALLLVAGLWTLRRLT
jgi:hypothetical protein